MKKIMIIISYLLYVGSVGASTEINYFVIQDQAQPFQIHVNKHSHSGIISDIVQQIFPAPEYQLKIHTLPFNRMVKMLEENKFKNWITIGSPNWPGVQSLNLSKQPIFEVKHSYLTSNEQNQPINSAQDLFGRTVILLHGFNYPGLEEYITSGKIKSIKVKSYPAAFKIVDRLPDKAGFVEMDIRIKYNMALEGVDEESYILHNFSSIIDDYNLHLAMSPEMGTNIQKHVNDALNQLIKSNKIAAIVADY